jgi:hypothetical protein
MGGGCTCNSNLKKYFYNSADCELNPGNNNYDNSHNNKNKMPEKNIKIIPKEEDIDDIKNKTKDSEKTKKQNDKNIVNNINSKMVNNSPNTLNDNKKIIPINNRNNSSLYLCSNNNSNKNITSNNNKYNQHIVSNTVIVNKNNHNNSNYQNQTQNNLGSKHKAVQKKILESEKVKKAETNYNYNLGEHNFIFINISQGSSCIKNESEKYESTTPKMAMEKENLDDMEKVNRRKFSHFYINKINQKPMKKQSNNNNKLPRADHSITYMFNYSQEMLKAINSLRKNPESFIEYIDSMVNNNIQIKNDEIYIISENVDEKIKLMEDYLLIFEQIKRSLKDIINSKIFEDLDELQYNEELEIDIEYAKNYINNQSHIERSSINNSKYLSNTNNVVRKKKKIDYNSTLDLSDDIIATLILNKRKELIKKYPENIFMMNIIKDINISILLQISMEIVHDYNKKMLDEIIFNPKYKNFAVSWANELNRNFISISCFA